VGYNTNVTDVCSGFFAWKGTVIENLVGQLESDGFSVEMEMITKMARMGYGCYSVPISYNSRRGESTLRPINDGIKILHAWLRNLNWKPNTKKLKTPSEATSKAGIGLLNEAENN
jgi:hypothetical protein